MGPRHTDQKAHRSDEAWEEAVRALVKRPIKVIPGSHRDVPKNARWVRSAEHSDVPAPLVELLVLSGGSGTPVTWGALMSLFAATLVRGDQTDPAPVEPRSYGSARSFREGARGTFFLDGLQFGVMPATKAEQDIVFGTKRVDGQARRWSGLRIARAEGRQPRYDSELVAATTAANMGTKHQADCAEQLISDLQTYLASRSGGARSELDSSTVGSDLVLSEWHTLAAEIAAALDVAAPPYPQHLTPSMLADVLTVSSVAGGDISEREGGAALGRGLQLGKVLERHQRLVVLGDPGSGKSTILIREVVERVRNGKPALMVRLPDLAIALGQKRAPVKPPDAVKLLVKVAAREMGVSVERGERGLAEAIINRSDALIALDGLDEIPASDMRVIESLLRNLRDVRASIVISSRKPGYVPPIGEWHELEVDALPGKYVSDFTLLWFGDGSVEKREQVLKAIRRPRMAELVRSPVLLGIICTVAGEGAIPEDRAELYERYVHILLQRVWRPRKEWRDGIEDLTARHRIAAKIAWISSTGGSVIGDDDVAELDAISLAVLRPALPPEDLSVAQEVLQKDALLRPYGRQLSRAHQLYIWSHRTVEEYLVGTYLTGVFKTDPTLWSVHLRKLLLSGARWQEPLMFMAQLLNEQAASALLRELKEIHQAGDLAGEIEHSVFRLMASRSKTSAARLEAAKWAKTTGRWINVSMFDVDSWLTDWGGPELRRDPSLIREIAQHQVHGPSGALLAQIQRYLQFPESDRETYWSLLTVLSQVDPDEAHTRYLAEVQAGCRQLMGAARRPRKSTMNEVLSEAVKLDPFARLVILASIANSDGDVSQIAQSEVLIGPADLQALALLLNWRTYTPLDAGVSSALYECIAKGEYGSDYAVLLGTNPIFDFIPAEVSMPYLQVGRSLRRLREVQVGSQRSGVSVHVEAMFATESIATHREAKVVIEGLTACLLSVVDVSPAVALRIYRKMYGFFAEAEKSSRWLSRELLIAPQLFHASVRIVRALPFDEILEALLASSPTEWAHAVEPLEYSAVIKDHYAFHLIDLLRTNDKPIPPLPHEWQKPLDLTAERSERLKVSDTQMADIVVWASAGRCSVLSQNVASVLSDRLENVLEEVLRREPKALSLAGNSAVLRDVLYQRGSLYRWRRYLVTPPGK